MVIQNNLLDFCFLFSALVQVARLAKLCFQSGKTRGEVTQIQATDSQRIGGEGGTLLSAPMQVTMNPTLPR